MNKMNGCFMIGSYVCGLNSEILLHTDKNHIFFLQTLKNAEKHPHLYFVSVHAYSQCILHRFRNELSLSLTNLNLLF